MACAKARGLEYPPGYLPIWPVDKCDGCGAVTVVTKFEFIDDAPRSED